MVTSSTLLQSSTSGCFILVHGNDIAVAKSGCLLCAIYSSFMTTEWKLLSLFPCIFLTFTTVNSHLASGDVTTWGTSLPNSCTSSDMYPFIFISYLVLFRCLIFIPKKLFMLSFVTVNPGNLSSNLFMTLSIMSCSACEKLLSSTY